MDWIIASEVSVWENACKVWKLIDAYLELRKRKYGMVTNGSKAIETTRSAHLLLAKYLTSHWRIQVILPQQTYTRVHFLWNINVHHQKCIKHLQLCERKSVALSMIILWYIMPTWMKSMLSLAALKPPHEFADLLHVHTMWEWHGSPLIQSTQQTSPNLPHTTMILRREHSEAFRPQASFAAPK